MEQLTRTHSRAYLLRNHHLDNLVDWERTLSSKSGQRKDVTRCIPIHYHCFPSIGFHLFGLTIPLLVVVVVVTVVCRPTRLQSKGRLVGAFPYSLV